MIDLWGHFDGFSTFLSIPDYLMYIYLQFWTLTEILGHLLTFLGMCKNFNRRKSRPTVNIFEYKMVFEWGQDATLKKKLNTTNLTKKKFSENYFLACWGGRLGIWFSLAFHFLTFGLFFEILSWLRTFPGYVRFLVTYVFEKRTQSGNVRNQETYVTRKRT